MNDTMCPRCGYDQQGALEAWRSAVSAEGEGACCPVHGVCSECGLRFAWGSLLNPELRAAEWLFEHAKPWWRVPLVSFRNGWSSLRGWRWWRRVKLEHGVKPLRLVVHWVVWALVAAVGLGVVGAAYSALTLYRNTSVNAQLIGVPFVWNSAFTEAIAREALHGFLWPWGRVSFRDKVWNDRGLDLVDGATRIVLLSVSMGVSFLLIPATMRRMRIRSVHLVRGIGHAAPMVAACMMTLAVVCAGLNVARSFEDQWYPDVGVFGVPDRVVIVTAIVWAWTGIWWWRFAREYLRLPRAGWVTGLLFVIAALGTVVLARPVEGVFEWGWSGLSAAWDQVRRVVSQ